MTQNPIRFAVIGGGLMARQAHIPNLLRLPEAQLVLCCDVSEDALAECRKIAPHVRTTTDFRAAIHDPEVDAILIATTETFRLPPVDEAVKAGKPVYCEKPLAKDLQDAIALQKLVKERGIPFAVGHNRRCSPALVEAQALFSAHMKSSTPCPWRFRRGGDMPESLYREDDFRSISIQINDDWWSWKPVHVQGQNAEIGLMISENTHFVDIACWFAEAEPLRVHTAFTGLTLHTVTIEFEGGHLATVHSGANGSFGMPKELYTASGRGGTITVDHMLEVRSAGIEGAPLIKTYPMYNDRHPEIGTEGGIHGWLKKKAAACEEAAAAGNPWLQFTAEPNKGHQHMLSEFIREIRGERGPVSPIDDAVRALKICVASVRSKREGRTVSLCELEE